MRVSTASFELDVCVKGISGEWEHRRITGTRSITVVILLRKTSSRRKANKSANLETVVTGKESNQDE